MFNHVQERPFKFVAGVCQSIRVPRPPCAYSFQFCFKIILIAMSDPTPTNRYAKFNNVADSIRSV